MKLILSLLALFFFISAYSQDTIVKRNGNIVSAKIVEDLPTRIRFNRYSDLDGPVYSIKKEKIAKIKYENGETVIFEFPPEVKAEEQLKEMVEQTSANKIKYITVYKGDYYEGDKKITKKECIEILETNPFSWNELQRRRNVNSASASLIVIGAGLAAVGFFWDSDNMVTSGGGLITTGILVGLFAPSRLWKAIEYYNRSLETANA